MKRKQKFTDIARRLFPLGLALVATPRCEAHLHEDVAPLAQELELVGETLSVSRLNQKPRPPVFDDFGCRAKGCANGGQTKTHPFEVDDAEAFIAGWYDEDVGLFEFVDEGLVVESAMKVDDGR